MSLTRSEKILIGSAAVIGVSAGIYAISNQRVINQLETMNREMESQTESITTQLEMLLAQNNSTLTGIEEIVDSIDECGSKLETTNANLAKYLRRAVTENEKSSA